MLIILILTKTEDITEDLSKPLRKITENTNENSIQNEKNSALEKNLPIHFSKESLELLQNESIQVEEHELSPRIEDPKRLHGGGDI